MTVWAIVGQPSGCSGEESEGARTPLDRTGGDPNASFGLYQGLW